MSVELIATIIGTAITITALASTILYSNKTLREGQKNTQKILKGHEKILKGHEEILSEIACAIGKIRADTKANVKIHGYAVAEDVPSIKEAEKLGDVIEYDPTLKICYYKPKKRAG